jgi:hypothetical protein
MGKTEIIKILDWLSTSKTLANRAVWIYSFHGEGLLGARWQGKSAVAKKELSPNGFLKNMGAKMRPQICAGHRDTAMYPAPLYSLNGG